MEVTWCGLRLPVTWLGPSVASWWPSWSRLGPHLGLDGLSLLVLADAAVVLGPLGAVVWLGRGGRGLLGHWGGGDGSLLHLLLDQLGLLVHPQRLVILGPLGGVVWLARPALTRHTGWGAGGMEAGLRLAVAALVSASSSTSVTAIVAARGRTTANLLVNHLLGSLDGLWRSFQHDVLLTSALGGVLVDLAVGAAVTADGRDGLPALPHHQPHLVTGHSNGLGDIITAAATTLVITSS